jgi:preprotein translocase subunit Sec61beta
VAATVDSADDVGKYTSVTIGADGLALISYFDQTTYQLKVLHCGNSACNVGNTATTVPMPGNVGKYTSITIGPDGLGLISYLSFDGILFDLLVSHCGNAACSSGYTFNTVDGAGGVGYNTSITIGADGLGLISYYDGSSGDLKVLHCGNAACTSGTPTTVDSTGDVGPYTSITIGADGLGLISYYDLTNANLKVLHCGNAACTSGTPTTVDSTGDVGPFSSITLGADGLGLISYWDVTNSDLKVLHCGNARCDSGNTITKVDGTGSFGQHSSVTIGADGLGLISYYDSTNGDLKVLHCGNAACNSGNISTTVDSTDDVGLFTSIAIGADGLGLISYYDVTNGDLKVFHCSNLTCTPYTRVGR